MYNFFQQCLVYFLELTCNIYWIFLTIDGYLFSSDRIIFILNLFQIIVSFVPMVFSHQHCSKIVRLLKEYNLNLAIKIVILVQKNSDRD
jgi:hypothetical protein